MKKHIAMLFFISLIFLNGIASAALLDNLPSVPLTGFNSTGKTSFTASTGSLNITAQPLQTNLVQNGPTYNIMAPRYLSINLVLDAAGVPVGVPGDDFVMAGTIDIDGDGAPEYSGVLLAGEILEMGYLDANVWPLNVDFMDFRFRLTGGALASYYGSSDIYIHLTIEFSTFSGVFTTDFNGGAKGWVTPVFPKCTGTIGDFVWHDLNRNGIQDAGEPGINDVTVNLFESGGIVPIATTTTALGPMNQLGYYQFSGLCLGRYRVEVDTPSGYAPTSSLIGSDRAIDSNGSPTWVDLPANNSSDQTIDFGFITPCAGSIGDFVWHDQNRNGIQDSGETGVAGVKVELYACDAVLKATTNTDTNGAYGFTNLEYGGYYVKFTLPAGYSFTPQNQGADDTADSDADPSTGMTACTVIDCDETDLTWDAGIYKMQAPGTGTPGYWKNHPDAWPVEQITIGGVLYSKDLAIYYMGLDDGDKTITMFRSLVAAKLNVLVGNEAGCIADTIAAADAWMASYGPVGAGVKAKSAPWKIGEPLYLKLDAYNNGKLCAVSRDYTGDPHIECPPLTTTTPPPTGGGGKKK